MQIGLPFLSCLIYHDSQMQDLELPRAQLLPFPPSPSPSLLALTSAVFAPMLCHCPVQSTLLPPLSVWSSAEDILLVLINDKSIFGILTFGALGLFHSPLCAKVWLV